MEALGRGIIAETPVVADVSLEDGGFRFTIRHGWLVEKGKRLVPVRDFTVAGNTAELLSNVTMLADDSTLDQGGWICGKKGQNVPVSQGMPSALVRSLEIEPLA